MRRAEQRSVAVLHNDVLPVYRALDLPVGAVPTDDDFCGTERNPYELNLALNRGALRAGSGWPPPSAGLEQIPVWWKRTKGFQNRVNLLYPTEIEQFFR